MEEIWVHMWYNFFSSFKTETVLIISRTFLGVIIYNPRPKDKKIRKILISNPHLHFMHPNEEENNILVNKNLI